MMIKVWNERAWEEYLYWQRQDKKTLHKINTLLKDISRNGYSCTGKPEPLKHELSGWWRVEIDKKNRLIFRLSENDGVKAVEILSCKDHYSDS
jgi:toxin YoeB